MWGENFHGQLGNGDKWKITTPIKIMDNVAYVSLGAHHKLESFLTAAEPEVVEILVSALQGQSNAITYKELREAYLSGGITEEQFTKWQQDYSKLIISTLAPK